MESFSWRGVSRPNRAHGRHGTFALVRRAYASSVPSLGAQGQPDEAARSRADFATVAQGARMRGNTSGFAAEITLASDLLVRARLESWGSRWTFCTMTR